MLRTAFAARRAAVLAVCTAAVSAAPARAAFVFTTAPGEAGETRLAGSLAGGITSAVTVGSADVTISGFGTYGRLRADGNLRFVIFLATDRSAPIFDSGPIRTTAALTDRWYDSPSLRYTLRAGADYRIGVIADQDFTYRWSTGGESVSADGLTLVGGVNGNTGSFAAPVNLGDGGVTNSLHALGTPQGPTPVTANPAPPGIVLALTGVPAMGLFLLRRGKAGRG